MIKMFPLLLLVCLFHIINANPNSVASPRIHKGRDTTIEEFPYQVALERDGRFTCGGSIISPSYVLTAGHCIRVGKDNLRIRAGSSLRGRGGSVHEVVESVRHENYTQKSYYSVPENDIGLLRVEPPMELDESRRPIELYDEESRPGTAAVISGWGQNEDGVLPVQLQTITIPIVSRRYCFTAYAMHGGLFPGQICVLDGQGSTTCNGDSGGPLAIDGRVAGVVSGGRKCGHTFYPMIFTEVAYFRDWIKKHAEL